MSKVAVITGAGTGIGKASALALLASGWQVVFAGRRGEVLQKAIAEAGVAASRALAVPTDVGNAESVRKLFAAVRERYGRLDLLFNNAGRGTPGNVNLEDLTLEQWQAVLAANLTGAFLCTQEAFRIMKQQSPRGGRIINNGSISAHAPRPNSSPYTASAWALGRSSMTHSDIAVSQIIGNARPKASAGAGDGRTARWPWSRAWACSMSRRRSCTWRGCRSMSSS
jgi:NAD(P)-dependent dehydrogenase (short-subunit alcohol dehydrogenase family)